jgi:hypothetical protein
MDFKLIQNLERFSTFDQIFFVFHELKTGLFCYSLKLNFICYPNRFFTYDYSLWDGGDICFCGQKQTLILYVFVIILSKARVTGTIPYCHGKVPHSRKLLNICSNDFKGVLFF